MSILNLSSNIQKDIFAKLPYQQREGCRRVSVLCNSLIDNLQALELNSEPIRSSQLLMDRYLKLVGKKAFPSNPHIQYYDLENENKPFKILIKNYTNYKIELLENHNIIKNFFIVVDNKKISINENSCCFIFKENKKGDLFLIVNDFTSNSIEKYTYENFKENKILLIGIKKIFTLDSYFDERKEEEKIHDMNQILEEMKNGSFQGYFKYFDKNEKSLPKYKLEKKDELEEMIKCDKDRTLLINYFTALRSHGDRSEEFSRFFWEIMMSNPENMLMEVLEEGFDYFEKNPHKICNLYTMHREKEIDFPSPLKKKIINIVENEIAFETIKAESIITNYCKTLKINGITNIKAEKVHLEIFQGRRDFSVVYRFEKKPYSFLVPIINHNKLIDKKIHKVKNDEIIDCFLKELKRHIQRQLFSQPSLRGEKIDLNFAKEESSIDKNSKFKIQNEKSTKLINSPNSNKIFISSLFEVLPLILAELPYKQRERCRRVNFLWNFFISGLNEIITKKQKEAGSTLINFCKKLQIKGINNIVARNDEGYFRVDFKFDTINNSFSVYLKKTMTLIRDKIDKVNSNEIIECFLADFIQEIKKLAVFLYSEKIYLNFAETQSILENLSEVDRIVPVTSSQTLCASSYDLSQRLRKKVYPSLSIEQKEKCRRVSSLWLWNSLIGGLNKAIAVKKVEAEDIIVNFCKELRIKGIKNNITTKTFFDGANLFSVLFTFEVMKHGHAVYPEKYNKLIEDKFGKVTKDEIIECFLKEFIEKVKKKVSSSYEDNDLNLVQMQNLSDNLNIFSKKSFVSNKRLLKPSNSTHGRLSNDFSKVQNETNSTAQIKNINNTLNQTQISNKIKPFSKTVSEFSNILKEKGVLLRQDQGNITIIFKKNSGQDILKKIKEYARPNIQLKEIPQSNNSDLLYEFFTKKEKNKEQQLQSLFDNGKLRSSLTVPEIKKNHVKSSSLITKEPLIAPKPQKEEWDSAFASLQEKYRGLTVSWNEEQTECSLAFSSEEGIPWSLKRRKKVKAQEIYPTDEIKKTFLRKMKSEMKKEQLTVELLPTRTNPSNLKISVKENKAPMDFKDFHNALADLILEKQNVRTEEKKEIPNSKEERKNIVKCKELMKKEEPLVAQPEIKEGDILSLLFDIGENILIEKKKITFLQCNKKKNTFMIPYFVDGRMSLSTPQGFVNIRRFFECIAATLNQYSKRYSKSNNFVNIIGVAPSFKILFHFQDHSLAELLKRKEELQSTFLEQTKQLEGGVFFPSLPISLTSGEKSIKKLTLDEKDNKCSRNEKQPFLIGQNSPAQPFTFADKGHEDNFTYHLAALADNPGDIESNNRMIYYLSYLLHATRLFHLLSYNFQDDNSKMIFKNLRNAIRHSHFSYKKIYEIIEGFVQACRTNNMENITNAINEVKIKLEKKEEQSKIPLANIWDNQIKEIKELLADASGDIKTKAQDALLLSCSISGKFKSSKHKYRKLYQKLGHQDFKKYYPELRKELMSKL